MIKPAIPEDEGHRLESLHLLKILDSPAEERFDRLTRLAKRMFNVPIALVSLVDDNRQWFKSCIGLSVSETSRDISFCGHAILGNEIFIISNAMDDPRFADNPLVLNEPHIRFYAGCPLKDMGRRKMGTLCIIDTKPRVLTEEDIIAFKDLAELAERELVAVQLATLDELTLISNRRGFMSLAQNSLNLCARQGIPASLIFFDLNNFKQINDQYGHAEGDKALKIFADQMKCIFRESDVFARIGGDEFVVLLTGATAEKASNTVARFRQCINMLNEESESDYEITFCDGIVAVKHDQKFSIEELLEQADALMYEMKHSNSAGCNRMAVK